MDKILADLREYEAFLETELGKVRAQLQAADGSAESRANTTDLVLEMLEQNQGQAYSAAEVEEAIRGRGWTTDSADPVNAVRAALARLTKKGDIESAGRGMFRIPPPPAPFGSDSGGGYNDPWGSAPPTSASPMSDDEPPF